MHTGPDTWEGFQSPGLPRTPHVYLHHQLLRDASLGCRPSCIKLHWGSGRLISVLLHQEVHCPHFPQPPPQKENVSAENIQGWGRMFRGWRAYDELDEGRRWIVS